MGSIISPFVVYAVVDIETTGLRATEDRITEIAVFVYDGEKIVDKFHSLINPEIFLPEFITRLTGITNEMLEDAPRFYEIAKELVKITENKIFVAHNVHFDYTFIKNEFKNLGFNFQRKTLCTVRLSRKIFPYLGSYSLANLCKHFHIENQNRHRAEGDALATTILFEKLLRQNESKVARSVIADEIRVNLPPKIKMEDFTSLPESTGVYYFLDDSDEIIYVGKSKNIKKRIASHFASNLKSKKSIEFKNMVAGIDYELTGSELIALLLESDEIKKHKPLFNRAQRRSRFPYGIFYKEDKKGYLQFFVDLLSKREEAPLTVSQSAESARRILYHKAEQFGLCMKLCNLYQSKNACFAYQVKQCQGACIGLENPESYNERVQQAMESLHYYTGKTFFLLEPGRQVKEKAIVCVEKGKYLGFGYIDQTASIRSMEDAKNYIKTYKDNKDIQQIMGQWLRQHKDRLRPGRDLFLC